MNQKTVKQNIGLVLILSLILFNLLPAYGETSTPKRMEVDDQYKWDLTEFYSSSEEFYTDIVSLTV